MAISEQQLKTWSHQGATAQSAATYEAVKRALEDPTAPFYSKSYRVFLQGSYGNDTNIYADSDVDIGMCLSSTYYYDTSALDESATARFHADTAVGTYSFDDFKRDVLAWLKYKFGDGVKSGKKAIFVPGNGTRRDSDVLVCTEHRAYSSYDSSYANRYREGIVFWTSDGVKIVNYPAQHRENCTSKHQATNNCFKPNVRVLKNMRNTMIARGYIDDGLAPSYFLEGMLWNVPAHRFNGSYQNTFENYMHWLQQCNANDLTCANSIHYLLREGYPVCWSMAKFNEFRAAAMRFWGQGL